MIGILCSNDMEEEYSKQLHSWFRDQRKEDDDNIVVFTIFNINLKEKMVKGSLISGKAVKSVEVPLPSVIFNFSLQKDDAAIKVRKALEEMEKVELVNYINKFDQWMIMDILSSFNSTRKYLLPYHIYDKAERNFRPVDEKSYIIMPSRGASLSRVIYAVPDPDSDRITGSQYFRKGHICDYIDASLCQQRWLFIEIPEIRIKANHPVVVRVYLQKLRPDIWSLLSRDVYLGTEAQFGSLFEEIDAAAMNGIFHINKYLPSVGHCFMDFILDSENKPYFLHMGGLDQYFFRAVREPDFCRRFYKNMLKLARYYRHRQEGD
ncbi:MAG: hypothetical protein Q8930_04885 [Bacillota bacterium]|nr:hypothetical protein [Bacillota bacterium]